RRVRTIRSAGGYLTARDSRVHFGLGASTSISGIEIPWPDGQKERFSAEGVERYVILNRGSGKEIP
ncbi:RNA-binding protein, partial [Enterococcus hirae]